MDTFEYMRIKVLIISEEIIQQYQLRNKIHNEFVYMEIMKGMNGFPQAVIIYHNQLKNT